MARDALVGRWARGSAVWVVGVVRCVVRLRVLSAGREAVERERVLYAGAVCEGVEFVAVRRRRRRAAAMAEGDGDDVEGEARAVLEKR